MRDRKTFHQFHLIHSINSIQGTEKHYKWTNYRTNKIIPSIVIQNHYQDRQNQHSKFVITGWGECTITRQNQLLQFYILKAEVWRYNYRGTTYGEEEPLMMKAKEESDVACCCWWRGSRELLMMGKKRDRCRLAAVDGDWRGSRELLRRSSLLLMKRKPRPWALMTGVKTGLMTGVKKEKEWRLDRDSDRDRRRFCGCRLVN
jgi:hypothetical protein